MGWLSNAWDKTKDFAGDYYETYDKVWGGHLPGGVDPADVTGKQQAGAAIAGFFPVLYTGGAALNRATGGEAPLSPYAQVANESEGTTYSRATQFWSGYQGDTPNSGDFQIPIINETGREYLDEAAKDFIGLDLKQIAVAAIAVLALTR